MLRALRDLGGVIRSLFGPEHLWTILLMWVIIGGVLVVVANVLAASV